MRKLFPFIGIGCATILILGLIGGGIAMLLYGSKPYLDKLGLKKNDAGVPPNPVPVENQPIREAVVPIDFPDESKNLLATRAGYQTVLTVPATKQERPPVVPPAPPGSKAVNYGPGESRLSAYISLQPKDKNKRPAVIWVHDKFDGISDKTWQQAQPFREQGFIVMCPSFRGEHRNTGTNETFYGEVNDLLEAVRYVKDLDYVDGNRVYIAGLKGGATLTLLAATTGTTEVRAFFAIAPIPDLEEYLRTRDLKSREWLRFATDLPNEARLRSATRFTAFIKRPTFAFAEANTEQLRQAGIMGQKALTMKVPFESFSFKPVEKNDYQALIELFARKMAQDNGPKSNIGFLESDLAP